MGTSTGASSDMAIRRPRRTFWGLALVAGLCALILRCCVFPGCAFDAQRWHADTGGSGDRYAMADRFVASGDLLGKTAEEAVRMLGPSTEHHEFKDWDLIYYLGKERGWICLGGEHLVLRLSPDDKVCECRIMSDG